MTGGEAHEEISDNGVYTTTHKSFLDKRQRHSSVPQTARTQVGNKRDVQFVFLFINFSILTCLHPLCVSTSFSPVTTHENKFFTFLNSRDAPFQ